ncbi:hypothetical protein HPHPM2_0965 [Helicobacter pylori Hp M2]|nr:putative membrane protein [Helicobacter pylori Hp H-24b]EJC41819.1 hypothetical protein HPHPM2_0965 [Helicobacter pylori Hp M2]EJC46597.1 hypothetical protein HPHPM5_1131 [Helicobacter pylori Hp M5]EJC48658.1 hypothetical protein HPHPM6_1118 [Helicobacter pylori Hp M6]
MKKLKLWGVWFWLCVLIIGILQGLSFQSVFSPTRLRKILFNWIVGVKLIPLLGLNIL